MGAAAGSVGNLHRGRCQARRPLAAAAPAAPQDPTNPRVFLRRFCRDLFFHRCLSGGSPRPRGPHGLPRAEEARRAADGGRDPRVPDKPGGGGGGTRGRERRNRQRASFLLVVLVVVTRSPPGGHLDNVGRGPGRGRRRGQPGGQRRQRQEGSERGATAAVDKHDGGRRGAAAARVEKPARPGFVKGRERSRRRWRKKRSGEPRTGRGGRAPAT